jgi:hypothetical protein
MRRPHLQFQLSTLLWITLAVACWLGGMRVEWWQVDREWRETLAKVNASQIGSVTLQPEPERSFRRFRLKWYP